MKRIGHLHEQVCKLKNIYLADQKARKQKKVRWGIIKHDKYKQEENLQLQQNLKDLSYQTSKYDKFKIYEPKERIIYRLPYYPDRIAHHAIMNIMEPIWVNIFIRQTYSCIKNRGIHDLAKYIKRDLKNYPKETTYCLKMDIRKFYPSIDHNVLYNILKLKIKDLKLLIVLKGIIDSVEGIPIGNYLSQFFANLCLAYFDHWAKEELKCRFYYRYADDIVILSNDKNKLHSILLAIKLYLKHVLKLQLKPNYQIFPVESRGIDFVGYRFYHSHTLLRKSIKIRIHKLINDYKKNKITKEQLKIKMQSYFGWLKYCNSKNLLHHIQKETGLKYTNWNGIEVPISRFYNKYIHIINVINYSKYFKVLCIYNNKSYYFKSTNKELFYSLQRYLFPINFKIIPYVRT